MGRDVVTVDNAVDMTPDPVKLDYERRFDPMVDEHDVRCWSRQPIRDYVEGDPEFDLDPDTRIPVAWNEKRNGWSLKSRKRLCRFCHQRLPESFGKCPNITIGLCGNSAAGKTVYMLSLIAELGKLPNMAVTPDPVFFSEMETDYEFMYKTMYTNAGGYILPDATNPMDLLSPLVLNCQYSHGGRAKEFSITVYDMAGEGMKDPSYMAKQAIYLENAVGVIYLKNPEYFPGMSKAEDSLDEHAYLPSLMSAINTRNHGAGRARVAITMTKFDLILNKNEGLPEFDKLGLSDMMRDNPLSLHEKGFDIGKATLLNQRMYKLYNWENTRDQRIRSLYDSQKQGASGSAPAPEKKKGCLFGWLKPRAQKEEVDSTSIKQWVMLFAASPLGRNIQFIDGNRLATAPSGMLNIDPLLWLLYCCDIFPEKKSSER